MSRYLYFYKNKFTMFNAFLTDGLLNISKQNYSGLVLSYLKLNLNVKNFISWFNPL
jgi:hypothetical protein